MVGIAIELYIDRSFGIPTTLVLHYMQFLPIESKFFYWIEKISVKNVFWPYFEFIKGENLWSHVTLVEV